MGFAAAALALAAKPLSFSARDCSKFSNPLALDENSGLWYDTPRSGPWCSLVQHTGLSSRRPRVQIPSAPPKVKCPEDRTEGAARSLSAPLLRSPAFCLPPALWPQRWRFLLSLLTTSRSRLYTPSAYNSPLLIGRSNQTTKWVLRAERGAAVALARAPLGPYDWLLLVPFVIGIALFLAWFTWLSVLYADTEYLTPHVSRRIPIPH